MKLVGYVRVSTNGQVEHGQGLEVQEKAIARWTKKHGHRLVATYRDEGVSGTTPAAERPGLRDALALVQDGQVRDEPGGLVLHRQVDGLVAARLDRLARHLHEQEAILGQVWMHGGTVFLADIGEVKRDDPDDPARTAIRQMLGVFAQLDRSTLVKRMRDGRHHKASKGGYAFGAPPMGYRAEGRELVPDTKEQQVVNIILAMSAAGKSTRAIAEQLQREGHKTKYGKDVWHSATVARVLNRQKGKGQ